MDTIKNAKELILVNDNISIAVSPVFQQDSFPASLALLYSLKKIGKKANLIAENPPEKFDFLITENTTQELQKADMMISIKEAGAKFSHLVYEKGEGALNLFVETRGAGLTKDNITLQYLNHDEKNSKSSLLITVGIEKFKQAEIFTQNNEFPILNIDTEEENEKYGDVNLVKTESASISEIIFDLISALEEAPFEEKTANCLLAGIIYATRNLQSPKINAQTFQKLGCLSEFGKSAGEIKSLLYGKIEKKSMRIFAKILHKIQINPELNLAWALLSNDDFQKTNSNPTYLKFAIRKLTSGLFPFNNLILIWEQESSPVSARGIFYSQEKENLEKVEKLMFGERKGDGVIFKTNEASLKSVKDKILEAIKN